VSSSSPSASWRNLAAGVDTAGDAAAIVWAPDAPTACPARSSFAPLAAPGDRWLEVVGDATLLLIGRDVQEPEKQENAIIAVTKSA
jgi:hypothetical protein